MTFLREFEVRIRTPQLTLPRSVSASLRVLISTSSRCNTAYAAAVRWRELGYAGNLAEARIEVESGGPHEELTGFLDVLQNRRLFGVQYVTSKDPRASRPRSSLASWGRWAAALSSI